MIGVPLRSLIFLIRKRIEIAICSISFQKLSSFLCAIVKDMQFWPVKVVNE